MKTTILISLASLYLLTLPVNITAQEQLQIVQGTRIRFIAPGFISNNNVGSVLSIKPDTLMLEIEDSEEPLELPIAKIVKLEMSLGRKTPVVKGAKVGFFTGFITVYIIMDRVFSDAEDYASETSLICAGIGGVAASLLGAGIGAVNAYEQWQEVSIQRLRKDRF